jgi:hypothetical protein
VLVPFVTGVVAITITSGITYLSQWFFASPRNATQRIGFVLNIVAIVLGLSSYGAFIWGMNVAYQAFRAFVYARMAFGDTLRP